MTLRGLDVIVCDACGERLFAPRPTPTLVPVRRCRAGRPLNRVRISARNIRSISLTPSRTWVLRVSEHVLYRRPVGVAAIGQPGPPLPQALSGLSPSLPALDIRCKAANTFVPGPKADLKGCCCLAVCLSRARSIVGSCTSLASTRGIAASKFMLIKWIGTFPIAPTTVDFLAGTLTENSTGESISSMPRRRRGKTSDAMHFGLRRSNDVCTAGQVLHRTRKRYEGPGTCQGRWTTYCRAARLSGSDGVRGPR